MPLAFVMARINVALLDERGEAIGLRKWLLFPPLLVVYVPVFLALVGGPALPLANFLNDDPSARNRLSAFVDASPWIAVPGAVALALGCWWTLLGLVGAQLTSSVRALFRPFANRYDRRHATRLALTGVVFAVIGTATLTLPRFLVARLSAQEATLPEAKPVDSVGAIVDAFRTRPLVAVADPHGNEQVTRSDWR